MSGPLDPLTSIKTKLGALVGASVVVATLVALIGSAAGVPWLLVVPVTVALSLAVTQLLAAGMVAPLRQMTDVARAMARGDYSGRVHTLATDEVGQLARAFNQMAQDLATVDRERRDLIATVSHELRTPLSAMTALLDNLADGVVPADQPHLDEALAQAERLRDLVADLLELSRLEAGVTRLSVEPIDLGSLVSDCVTQVRASGRSAEVVVHVPTDLRVPGDPARLRQLAVNLLDNTARHSPPGGTVLVEADHADAGGWWLQVTDAGPGVAAADRERVFERFGTDATGGGTGLGLAVARWVAQLHGGTLRFVDGPDEQPGARLRLEIPAQPPLHHPQRQEPTVPTTQIPPTAAAPPVHPATTPGAHGGLDTLFGRFWPEPPGLPGIRVTGAAAIVGLLAGVLFSFQSPGLGATITLVSAGAAALVTARRRREPWTLACAILALLLVLPLTLRDADWIGVLCLFAAAAVFLAGVCGARTLRGIVASGLSWPLASLRGLPWWGRSLRVVGTGGRTPAVVRTVVLSLVALGVFGALFASADALFASWVDALVPTLTFGTFVGRAFVAGAVFAMTLGAAYLALNPSQVEALGQESPTPLAHRFEWLVPVLAVDLVFVGFLAAQAAAVFGGHGYVERTTGLTYADYVHQGFGQLTLATALTLLVVWVAARRAGDGPADRWWLRGSLGLLCLLTLVVVGSALHRMHVYQEAYGFTTLRLTVDVFEGWLGFVVVVVMVAGLLGRGARVTRVALVSGAVALLGLAAINPDAWVAERNIDRYESTGSLDLDYLQGLSDDATPVIVERLPERISECLFQIGLGPDLELRAWNLGDARAEATLRDVTPPPLTRAGFRVCDDVWREFAQDTARATR